MKLMDPKKRKEVKNAIQKRDGRIFKKKEIREPIRESQIKIREERFLEKKQERLNNQLSKASENGDLKGVKKALDEGAEVDTGDDFKSTPLMIAAQKGHKKIVELLLEAGAEVDLKDAGGYNAIVLASSNGETEIVKLLVDNGADIGYLEEFISELRGKLQPY